MADFVQVILDTRTVPESALDQLEDICREHPGSCRLVLQVRSAAGNWTLEAKALKVNPSKDLVEALRLLVVPTSVRVAGRGK